MLFLTELGLYRLLGQSRMPVARPFQKWVATVMQEIRLKGRYDLEEQRTQAQRALEAERTQTRLSSVCVCLQRGGTARHG